MNTIGRTVGENRNYLERQIGLYTRESGIELLKIIAIFFIVISHVLQTLRAENTLMMSQDYVINLAYATTNIQYFILTLMSYFGVLGNNIFFICSAWFLLKSNSFKKKKWLFMLIEVWVISVLILLITLLATNTDISVKNIIKSILPTLFSNNWYSTCYLLFYPIHPILNKIIYSMEQKTLLRSTLSLAVLYCGFNFIRECLFPSRLILWVTIYFIIAYLQIYMKDFCNSTKLNEFVLIIGFVCYICLALVTNVSGFYISFMNDKMLHWINNCNPILIAISVAMFNLFRKIKFKSLTINYVSSLSLLIYLIHENLILKKYFRPLIWNYVYTHFGYECVLIWALLISMMVFLVSLICSVLYDKTLRKLVSRASERLYSLCCQIYEWVEGFLIKFH